MENLRIPGPTSIPSEIASVLSRPMINHRGPEFGEIVKRVTDNLQFFFQTSQPVLGFPTAGSGAMEAAIVNCFSPDDEVLVVSIGVFGHRFAKISKLFGLRVRHIEVPWGQAAQPAEIACQLEMLPNVRGVLITHNETSTGVTNDLCAIAHTIRRVRSDILIIVDAISSLACTDLCMDEWDLDVVLTASQKGWMAPPGLAMIGVSQRAWQAHARATLPRFYWDFATTLKWLEKGQTPWTPPITVYYGLDVALAMMRAEGCEAIFARHRSIGELVRERVRGLGLHLFADPAYASNTVTAIKVPDGIEAKALLKALREQEGVVIAGGQERLDGQVIRIGHLGYVQEYDIIACMEALERQLVAMGYQIPVS